MKQNYKIQKILSLILSVLLLFSSIPTVFTNAEETESTTYSTKIGPITYTCNTEDGYATVTDCGDTLKGPANILSEVDGLPVTSIDASAFSNCTTITSVVFPSTIESIGEYAFNGCKSLKSFEFPEALKSIGDYAFTSCTGLTSVTIPESLEYVGLSAFNKCTAIATVTIENLYNWCNIQFVGYYSNPTVHSKKLYIGTELVTNLVIPEGITRIGSYAFLNCTSINSVEIPSSVDTIGTYGFYKCSGIKNINIPISVKTVETSAFTSCTGLELLCYCGTVEDWNQISIGIQNENFTDVRRAYHIFGEWTVRTPALCLTEGTEFRACQYCSAEETQSIPALGHNYENGICTLCEEKEPFAFEYVINDPESEHPTVEITKYISEKTVVNIPSEIESYPVTKIGNAAFKYIDYITSVTIPESVTVLGDDAFYGCEKLEEISIPDSVTEIGQQAFYNCTSLKSAVLPSNITKISISLFQNCTSLEAIVIPENVIQICHHAFTNCSSLKSVSVPDNITSIDNYAFDGCLSLEIFDMPDKVERIGGWAFRDCNLLTSIEIPDTTTNLGDWIFAYCSELETVTMGKNVKSIGSRAFYYCSSLKEIIIPSNVSAIADSTFGGCSSLTKIVIPNAVNTIGNGAFSGCNALEKIVYCGTPEEWTLVTVGTSNDVLTNATLQYHEYSDDKCVFCDADKPLPYEYNITDGVVRITKYTGDTDEVIIPEIIESCPVKAIGEAAFKDCATITSVIIPDCIEEIGISAFENCVNLANIDLPEIITNIGENAFVGTAYYNDTDNWYNNVFYIGDHCIRANVDIKTTFTIKKGTKVIVDYAFYNCTLVTSITIPDGVKVIGNYSFQDCNMVKTFNFPDSLEYIGEDAFWSCNYLTTVIMPKNLKFVGMSAFYRCYDIKSVYIKDLSSWCNVVFEGFYSNPMCYGVNFYLNSKILKDVVIPDDVERIGSYAFLGCSAIEKVTITPSVHTIGTYAFYQCTGLSSICIPNTVTTVETSAFSYDSLLKNIYYNGTSTEFSKIAVGDGNSYFTLAKVNYINTGDLDCDGNINSTDLTSLRKLIITNGYNLFADINGDKKINVLDIVRLKKNLSSVA